MFAWIDSHAHLDDRRFDSDLESVLDRAREAGVQSIVTIGVDLPSSRAAVALAERYEGVYAAVGVQPNAAAQVGGRGAGKRASEAPLPDKSASEARPIDESTYGQLRELLDHPRVVAVGEIGLDYYWDQSPRDVQHAVLEAQLGLAGDTSKPVIIHIRDKRDQTEAYGDALAILRNWVSSLSIGRTSEAHVSARQSVDPAIAPAPGVLHCFSGSAEIAETALALGFYLGVDGPVTYPNASARPLQALVAELPLDRVLLETDCPYLAPQARRGRRNEPGYLPFIGVKVAELKGIPVADVARATAANAQRLFRLEPSK